MDKKFKIVKNVGIVGFGTSFSRILGYLRDMAIASKFGAGLIADAFFIAFMIPNLFRQLFGEGALSAAFIPVFSDYLTNKSKESAWQLTSIIINLLLLLTTLIAFLGILFSPYIISIIAPGFSKNVDLTILLTRIMFPFVIFICMAALFMGALNAWQHFSIPALAPAFLNITMIVSIYFLSPCFEKPILGLALGVLIGGLFQMGVQIIPLIKKGFTYQFILRLNHPGVKRIYNLMIPAVAGLAITQVNLVISRILASFLDSGSISALYYANRLIWLPISLFGISVGTVSFAMMSDQVAKNDLSSLKETLLLSLRMIVITTVPAAIGLIVLGKPIIALLFQRGEFTATDTLATNIALFYYSLGIFAFASLKVIISTFYAFKDTKTPFKIGIVVVISNFILSLLLMPYLKHGGLALATTLSAFINLIVLVVILRRMIGHLNGSYLSILFIKTLGASLIMGIVCWKVMSFMRGMLLLQIVLAILIGLIVLFICYKLFKVKEIDSLLKKIVSRSKKIEN
ncbi:MAG: murein biosynthesis integral membrane protein MurJ [bacterium]|nr:murein biosynthesis integral membrane protein MurJ [bacterium]